MVRRDRLSGPTEIAPYAAPPPEGEIAAMEERQIVRESLVELGEPCRSLLEALFGIDSPDYSSISARLSIPIGSIGPTRSRCLAKLRGVLRPRLGASR
jgi:DNA-directed RNA polymerase specialized sigma24 family protein